jgi:serine/threonine protein kinase
MAQDRPIPGTAMPGPAADGADQETLTPPHTGVSAVGEVALPARFGRYTLVKLLGKGGMGAVYLADDPNLDRQVALKIPHLVGSDSESLRCLRDRFVREARLAAVLHHPNLCPVHDCGEIDGVLYMAMAYLEGRPLAAFIRSSQPPPVKSVVAVVRRLALAMQEAHSQGVIHRDLKPSNIMVTPSRQPVIMDFGLAVRTEAEDTRLTRSGMIVGTPAYMPPEQLNCDHACIGPATDIYALGVILYELLAGRTPFQGPLGALMAQIMIDPPPPLEKWRPGLDRALDGLCSRALTKKPQDRYPSMQSFANALEEYLRMKSRTVPAPARPPAPAATSVAGPVVPLEQENAVTLFNEMAANERHATTTPRAGVTPRPGPSRRHAVRRRRRLRQRFRLPAWVFTAIALVVVLGGMTWLVVYLTQHIGHRRSTDAQQTDSRSDAVDAETPAELRAAIIQLRQSPGDAEALKIVQRWSYVPSLCQSLPPGPALEAGKHLAFDAGDWLSARRLFQQSGDRAWLNVLEKDRIGTASGADAADKMAAADAWWELAQNDNEFGDRIRPRARKLYGEAVQILRSGPEYDRAARRAFGRE